MLRPRRVPGSSRSSCSSRRTSSASPDNYIPANPLVTPPHIVPEWYFLPYYAILRSIPNKLLGVDRDVRVDRWSCSSCPGSTARRCAAPASVRSSSSCSGCSSSTASCSASSAPPPGRAGWWRSAARDALLFHPLPHPVADARHLRAAAAAAAQHQRAGAAGRRHARRRPAPSRWRKPDAPAIAGLWPRRLAAVAPLPVPPRPAEEPACRIWPGPSTACSAPTTTRPLQRGFEVYARSARPAIPLNLLAYRDLAEIGYARPGQGDRRRVAGHRRAERRRRDVSAAGPAAGPLPVALRQRRRRRGPPTTARCRPTCR